MNATSEFKRAWFVVVACSIGVATGMTALPFYNLGAFIVPLQKEFGWDRTTISLAHTFMTTGLFLSAPLLGALCDKYGVRKPALISMLLLGPLMASLYFLNGSIIFLFLGFLAFGSLGSGTSPITYTRAINSWFDKGRGLALGLTLMGTGIAGAISPSLINHVVQTEGWRTGWLVLGGLSFMFLPVIWFGLKERGRDEAPDQAGQHRQDFGLTRGEALRTRQFWLMGIGFLVISLVLSGMVVNIIPMLQDSGVPVDKAAGVQAKIGLSVIAGRIIIGQLIDRFFAPFVALSVFLITALGIFELASGGPEMASFAAFVVGFTIGAEVDLMAFLVSRYFGMRNYAAIYSLQYGMFIIGAAFSPPAMNMVNARMGSYDLFLYAGAAAIAVAAFAFANLGRYPEFAGAPHEG